MSACTIRLATREDAETINSIQNYYVERSTATFLTELLTLDERLAWLDEHSTAHPVTVAVADGSIVGWGALGTFRPRAAYSRTAELSVYVHQEWHRRAIGREIVSDLLARGRALGYHAVVGGCCSEAAPSIALLEALGFSRVAHFPEVGYKFGRWLDVVFLQRLTSGHCDEHRDEAISKRSGTFSVRHGTSLRAQAKQSPGIPGIATFAFAGASR